ncbi:hypothetical protein DFR58_12743 [Anaerobacterium chartisolvens]|uniref:Uncharacterized protein n=1 Tax=Anaerobacterium chartisolvens TaxID=1297424 RepID=A0A369ASH3_9FIRM|nr:NusG domain II-containing protein [Anaerobacterium chartisolvens]RCX11167.1 hypothetical protein DFR58_12743 [Anaerobacterium chartisolvens]
MFKKGDIILILSIALIAAAGYISLKIHNTGGSHRIAVIIQNDSVIKRIDLDKVKRNEKIKIPGKYNETAFVEKGRIRFGHADCPDELCVKAGWLTHPGDMAVCIPNRAIIKIEGYANELDGVAY